jgi:proliferating cell nuclear antigen PCNA
MFEVVMEDGGASLRKMLEVLTGHVTEGIVEFSENGLTFQSLDSAHVAFVEFWMRPSVRFKITHPDFVSVGMNFVSLINILKFGNPGDKLVLTVTPTRMSLVFTHTARRKKFDLELLDLGCGGDVVAPFDTPDVVQMRTAEFQNIIKNLSSFADDVTMGIENGELSFVAAGKSIHGRVTADVTLKNQTARTVRRMFSLEYLAWFSKGIVISEFVSVSISESGPLTLRFDAESVSLCFHLAPKV